MLAFLLLLQLWPWSPITKGYAVQHGRNVDVTVTFTDVRPVKVCSYFYAIEDTEMVYPVDHHCATPDNDIGWLDTWKDTGIDDGNWKVVVTYPGGHDDIEWLIAKVNS